MEDVYNIDELLGEIEEHKTKLQIQQEFNTIFIIRFVIFVNLYRFYSTFIDPEEIRYLMI
jgi:hypothetical protein